MSGKNTELDLKNAELSDEIQQRERAEAEARYLRLEAMSPERRRLREGGILTEVGVFAFLAGLVLGWWRKR